MDTRDYNTVELINHNFDDAMVVKAARVSTKGEFSSLEEANEKFIDWLLKEKHMSPFEHGSATFLITCPIFTAIQFMRHRSLSFNAESGRYRELRDVFYLPGPERPLVQVGKPGAYVYTKGTEAQALLLEESFMGAYYEAYRAYSRMLEAGIAKEIARAVLPVGLMTSFYVTFNPRTLMMFLELRDSEHAQYEIRKVAELIKAEFALLMPLTYASWVRTIE